ncbi:MAG: helix-turn-helix domain-containing protein [Peptococcaceae bacterium]|nr:helix-turn-helix domain-containing protein [Peptococcaceae bacterium]
MSKTAIGKRIREARKKAGLTQAALGKKSGLATSTICDIEKGRIKPSLDSLERIAAALGAAPSFFLSAAYENNVTTGPDG